MGRTTTRGRTVQSDDDLLTAVAQRLRARTNDLVDAQVRVLRGLRSYDQVPDDDLVRSCHRNVERVVATFTHRGRLPEHIEEDELASGRRRALQGVAADDVAEAYRAVLAVLRDAFIEEAAAASADPWAVLAGARRLWDLTDRYTGVLVSARQQVEIEDARRDEQRRMALVRRLLGGSVDPSELSAGGALRSVLNETEYWVSRCRVRSGDTGRLIRHLEGTTRGRPLTTPVDEDVVAITATRPRALEGAVIAAAGPVPLAELPQAFTEASRVLTVAVRYGRTGVVDRSSLSVRMAVQQQTELGEQLYQRYLAALEGTPAGRELLATVRAHLDHRRSVSATATALSVHENTVRYRLDRFRQLTGADLADTDVLVEVWWGLRHGEIRSPAPGAPDGGSG